MDDTTAVAFGEVQRSRETAHQTLKEWLHRRDVAPADFLRIAVPVVEALGDLHARGLLHRDINPWNVVIDAAGGARLRGPESPTPLPGLDGLAAGRGQGVAPRLGGDLAYIAPEETGRVNRLVDQRADLYSLGAVLYELLTGRPPFVTLDPVELVHAHLARAPIPPAEARPSVPSVFSDIVLRLLAKMPEARYQSAHALLADLRQAEARLDQHGGVAAFELGLADLAAELPLPERLYLRDRERDALQGAWHRTAAGPPEVVVLAGPAGIGKSALARELREPIAARRGLMVTVKFDQHSGRGPYAPLGEALTALVRDLLEAPAGELALWQKEIAAALGDQAGALTDLVPELARLLGSPPALPLVGAAETESRFRAAFDAFIRALATPLHPGVLFLDDLQWSDSESLRLFEGLATAPDLGALLFVVALRPEECPADHAVTQTLARLAQTTPLQRIELRPLTAPATLELCRDVFACPAERAQPLAMLLWRKTAGNPFFIRRMLRFLQQSGLLCLEPGPGRWTWDLAEIEKVEVSENVVDLLLVVLRALPAPVRELLEMAACIGTEVPVAPLAVLSGRPIDEVARALGTAVRGGLGTVAGRTGLAGTFQFAHDRVRQAAYLLLDEPARQRLHRQIGRQLLLQANAAQTLDDQIYAIVDHLDRGRELAAPEERRQLWHLHLRAARKARASSALAAALDYLKLALALLSEDAWQEDAAETRALHHEAIQLAGYSGETALVGELFDRARAHARSRLEQAELYNIRMYVCVAQRDRAEAFRWGIEGVRLFGIELPLDDPSPAIAAELAAIPVNLAGRTPAQLLDGPRMQDPEQLACHDLLCTLLDACYFQRPELFPFLVARTVNLSLVHGNAPSSPQSFGSYAVFVGAMTQDYAAAHAFGQLSLDLAARFGDPLRQMRVLAMFTTCVNNWTAPLATTLPFTREGLARALKVGDSYFAAAFSFTEAIVRMHQGSELGQVSALLRAAIVQQRAVRNRRGVEEHLVFLHAIRRLQGLALQQADLQAAGLSLDDRGFPTGLGEESGNLPEYQLLRLGVAFLLRDLDEAFAISTAVADELQRVPRFVQHVEHNFYTSLTLAARASLGSDDGRGPIIEAIAARQQQLALWARNSPENYAHKHLLVAAELARLQDNATEAAELYDRAITAAARERFVQDEAIGNELCGRFYLAQGRRRIADLYLGAAVEGYARWGAKAKVDALEAEFPELERAADSVRVPGERGATADNSGGANLDLLALYRAAEAVSGEVMLPRLLGKLMEVCLATAGAERGAFVLEEDGELFVRAVGAVAEPAVLQRVRLDASPDLPGGVLREVACRKEARVAGDAAADPLLASDPCVVARGVRSLLALPIVRQTRLLGVLYLENNLATRVFTPERVRLLTTLSSQLATSLQNSLLFERLSQEIDERKRAEATVRFLADAGAALAESLEGQSTLQKLTALAVPTLADWCIVHVVDKGMVEAVASAHVDPALHEAIAEQLPLGIGRAQPRHVAEVAEMGAPVVFTAVTQEIVDRYASSAAGRQIAAAVDARSSMILPLRAHGRFLGAMLLASNSPDRRFDGAQVAAAEELARRAALAIDNARLYREATEAVRLRDEFLSIASHELNTPITSLKLLSQTYGAADAVPPLAVFTKVMGSIDRQSQRLATLVAALLDVAQIAARQFQLHRESLDLGRLVQSAVELHRGDLERAKCEVSFSLEPDLRGRWDPSRLRQVVANLLSNAMKFGPGKPIEVTVAPRGSGWARLQVADHGMGIAGDRLPHIFGRFERGVPASHYGGLGLGLYLVRAIVEAHDGTLAVTSEPGRGARFTIDLPLAAP